MTEAQEKRMKELVEIVNKYRIHYHVYDKPLVSDKEYDKLFYELVDLETETGVVLPSSPTLRVGADPLDKFVKQKHLSRLFSLDKAQSVSEISEWIDRNQKVHKHTEEFSVEYKFDGLAMEIVYENGVLVRAVTRGNGEVGEDVTQQIKTIQSVPLSIPSKDLLGIQGEAIMRLSVLDKFNKTSDEPLKNARNAAAGAVRNLDPKETAKRHLDFMAYNINYSKNTKFKSQKDIHDFLVSQGFFTGDYFVLAHGLADIEKQIKHVEETKNKLDFLIDGMVIKLNSVHDREELGFTDRFPRGMIAYKFEPEETSTILKDVVWQVGRTGKLTPVAELEPVELAGATIVHSTLNNYGDILRKQVKIGSRVFIHRSNEVIPEILGVAEDFAWSRPVEIPSKCPSCGSALIEDGANIFCPNETGCIPQIVGRLVQFSSRNAMDIEGIRDKTALQLHTDLGVNFPSDLYSLSREKLLSLDKFKDKKADNLLAALEKSKHTSLARFLFSLGIDGVGRKTAKTLEVQFKTLENVMNATKEQLIAIDDIAEIMAENILFFFRHHRDEVERLLSAGINIEQSAEVQNAKLAGEKIVLTGSLSSYTRPEATQILEKLGAQVQTSVSKNTTIVVAGENAGSKLDKAISLGVKIINEDEFVRLIGE